MRDKRKREAVEQYNALALYAISNGKAIKQTLTEFMKSSSADEEIDGRKTAEQVAAKLGVKINWKGGEGN